MKSIDISCQTLQILTGDTLDFQNAFPAVCLLLKQYFSPPTLNPTKVSMRDNMCLVSKLQFDENPGNMYKWVP